ncbi:unnamed protein product [Effrenium voratum]|nr:unnamed protein product [Effrenium voratum]
MLARCAHVLELAALGLSEKAAGANFRGLALRLAQARAVLVHSSCLASRGISVPPNSACGELAGLQDFSLLSFGGFPLKPFRAAGVPLLVPKGHCGTHSRNP